MCTIIPAWKHTFLHSTRTTHPKLSDDDHYYASSRFRCILGAVFRFSATLLTFPDSSTFVTLATLCLLFVIAIIRILFFLFVTKYMFNVRQSEKGVYCSQARMYRVHVERPSKTTDSSSRFRKTISILVIMNHARLITIRKK